MARFKKIARTVYLTDSVPALRKLTKAQAARSRHSIGMGQEKLLWGEDVYRRSGGDLMLDGSFVVTNYPVKGAKELTVLESTKRPWDRRVTWHAGGETWCDWTLKMLGIVPRVGGKFWVGPFKPSKEEVKK